MVMVSGAALRSLIEADEAVMLASAAQIIPPSPESLTARFRKGSNAQQPSHQTVVSATATRVIRVNVPTG